MIWFAIACVLHLMAGFLYVSSGLIAPLWGVVVLLLLWILLAVTLVRRRATGPRTLTIPFVAAAIWFLVLSIGGRFLGWTA